MPAHNRRRFLVVACLFEGGLAVLAILVGWLAGVDPRESLKWGTQPALVGAAAAIPIFLLFAFSFQDPFLGLKGVREILLRVLGAPLAACRWYHMLLLAVFAGVGEELLFRGLLQPWLERAGGYAVGLVVSNVIFGLVHAVTLTYALAAGVIGMFLGWLLDATGERNVLVPMVTHTVYDYLAFLVVAAAYRTMRLHGEIDESGEFVDEKDEETESKGTGPEADGEDSPRSSDVEFVDGTNAPRIVAESRAISEEPERTRIDRAG